MHLLRSITIPTLVAQRGGTVRYDLVTTCPLCFGQDYRTWCGSCRAWPQMPLRLALEITVPPGITTGQSLRLRGTPLPDRLTLCLDVTVLPQVQARARTQSQNAPEQRPSVFEKIFAWVCAGLIGAAWSQHTMASPLDHGSAGHGWRDDDTTGAQGTPQAAQRPAAPAAESWANGTARPGTAASGTRPYPDTHDLFRNVPDRGSYDVARSRSYEREDAFRHGGNGYEADQEAQRRHTAEQDRRYREEQEAQRRHTEEQDRRYREEQAAQRRHNEEQERRYREQRDRGW